MLQELRENIKGFTAFILVGIIIIPFAFFGVDSLFVSGSSVEEAAAVEGESITELEVQRAVEMRRRQLLNQYEEMDPELVSEERLRAPVLDQLIRQQLMALTARDGGMAVADQTFNEIVRNSESFQSDGQFDPERYEFYLDRLGYTPRSYRETLVREVLANQLRAGIQVSSLLTAAQVDAFAQLTLQERSFDYASIPVADLTDQVTVSDEEIRTWYDNHEERFSVPRRIVVEGIELTPELLSRQVEVDEQTVRERFEAEQQAAREKGTTWRLAHILVEAKEDGSHQKTLEKIQRELEGGESFASLAKTHSQDPGSASQGGKLGTFTPDSLPEGFAPVLEDLENGEISDPVRIGDAFHVIKVIDSTEAERMRLSEQRDRIASELRREKARKKMPEYLDRLKEDTYTAERLQPVAKAMGLPLRVTEPFSRDGGEEGLARYPKVVEAAFSEPVLEQGYASEVLEVGEDHYAVIKLRENIPAHQRPLDEVREQIVERLKKKKARELAVARGQALLENDSAEPGREGVDWQTVNNATRFQNTPDPKLLEAVFSHPSDASLPVGGVVRDADSGVFVYELRGIDSGALEQLAEDEQRQLRRSLHQMLANRELQAYLQQLEAGAEIEK